MSEGRTTTVSDIRLIELPRIQNRAGNITAINNSVEIPFDVRRIYYIYDIPSGESRGGHAHTELHQLIVAGSGSFSARFDDGKDTRTISINRPDRGIYVQPGMWRELIDFSSGAIGIVLASLEYDPAEYIQHYEEFLKYKSL